MTSSDLIGGVNAAFIGVSDLARHLDLYVDDLGWEVASSGVIPVEAARALWGDRASETPFTELRAADAKHGRLILLQVRDQDPPPHPMQADTGLIAINMYTRDIEVTHESLRSRDQQFRTPPATWAVPLGDKLVSVTQAFLLAPDGVDVVFVEPAAARGTAAWDSDPARHYTELTSVVCHVPDFEAELAFWGPDGLGLSAWYDVTFTHPGLDEMAQLPPGSEMRLAFLAGDTTARLEVTRLADRSLGSDLRDHQRTGLHLGHTGWLFLVADLARILDEVRRLGGTVLAEAHQGSEELFKGHQVAFVNTPNGLPVTFAQVGDPAREPTSTSHD